MGSAPGAALYKIKREMFERRSRKFSLTCFQWHEFEQANGGGVTNFGTRSSGLPADPAFAPDRAFPR